MFVSIKQTKKGDWILLVEPRQVFQSILSWVGIFTKYLALFLRKMERVVSVTKLFVFISSIGIGLGFTVVVYQSPVLLQASSAEIDKTAYPEGFQLGATSEIEFYQTHLTNHDSLANAFVSTQSTVVQVGSQEQVVVVGRRHALAEKLQYLDLGAVVSFKMSTNAVQRLTVIGIRTISPSDLNNQVFTENEQYFLVVPTTLLSPELRLLILK